MRSGKSFFNATLYKKNLTRFWPVWGLYLVIWLFVLPCNLILSEYKNPVLRFSHKYVLDCAGEVGLVLAVAFPLLAAVAVWSYLYNHRSACLMHTLPIRREGLFLTNFLSGMTFFVGSNAVIFLLTLLAEVLSGCAAVEPLLIWFCAVTLMELFFFCFATFCAMFTGHILGLPAYYGILSALPVALVALLDAAFNRFVYGYDGIDGVYTAARWLTPVWNLGEHIRTKRIEEVTAGLKDAAVYYEFQGMGLILVYAVVGLILAGLALVVYRRRYMERAGDAVTVAWVRPVFQYGVAFCCALAFGVLFFEVFRGVLPETAWTLLVLMLISGAVGYFLAKMILEKSFRVFGSWKGCLPFLGVLVALVCVMEFDLIGFERRVPEADQVESVSLTGLYSQPYDEAQQTPIVGSTDPEVIRMVLALHQAVVSEKDSLEHTEYYNNAKLDEESGRYVETGTSVRFNVWYRLKNGDLLSRSYERIPVYAEKQDDPASISGMVTDLVNLPQAVEDAYDLSDKQADQLVELTLSNYYFRDGYDMQEDVAVSREAWEDVLNAVRADLAEGNIGRRYLMSDLERVNNCFVNDLTFVFYGPASSGEGVTHEVYPAMQEPVYDTVSDEPYINYRITVTLQTTARHTLAALEKVGVLEKEVCLLTQAQRELVNGKWSDPGTVPDDIELSFYAWDVLGGAAEGKE